MKKILIIIAVIFCITSYSNAQNYKTAIGIRGGYSNGITVKHFIAKSRAVEGIIASRWKGLNITGLYEIYKPAFDVNRLYWYYGFGGHIGFWNGSNVHWAKDKKDYTILGIDGILGLEYHIKEIPFTVSLDFKPAFNIVGNSDFWADEVAFSLRYAF